MTKLRLYTLICLLLLVGLYITHAVYLDFTQDDAFISYRYAGNFLEGKGLVFNSGERVEGYTNFFFIVILIFLRLFTIDFIVASKILGVASGVGLLILSFFSMKDLAASRDRYILPLSVPFLLSANSAFAYWSISGLETVLFSALIFGGLYLSVKKNLLFMPVLAVAALVRPEGIMVFATLAVHFYAVRYISRKSIRILVLMFTVLIVPQVVFRLYYYHDVFPNPFYAKTGFSAEYLWSGLGYFWAFLKNYGFWGMLIIVPAVGFRTLPGELRFMMSMVVVYTIYIILVGGDVLYGYRFFVPLLAPMYLLFSISLANLTARVGGRIFSGAKITFAAIMVFAGLATFFLPRKELRSIRYNEVALVKNMKYLAETIRNIKGTDCSVALATIGAFSYYSDASVIDLLGLTDRTIARNPRPLFGIESTWKERHYNIPYVMKRAPDLILFSTGIKPSAPAEKALFLSSRFRREYYPVFHTDVYMYTVYRKKADSEGEDRYFNDARFVNDYAEALYYNSRRKFDVALEYARQARESGPADFYPPLVVMGDIELQKGNVEQGIKYLYEGFTLSGGYAMTAADKLARYYELIGDTAAAEPYWNAIRKHNRLD
jgi:arabinofuranosyltransferase